MKYFDTDGESTRLGLAYSPGAMGFVEAHPGMVDYIEMPFEQLRHAPALATLQNDDDPDRPSLRQPVDRRLRAAFGRDRGCHPLRGAADAHAMAGRASRLCLGRRAQVGQAPPTTLTYTVCPQLSEETLACVTRNLASVRRNFDVPLIVENPPLYFMVPGSTMNLVDYIAEVLARSDTGLLLDLTHFLIGCLNTASDALAEIRRLPLNGSWKCIFPASAPSPAWPGTIMPYRPPSRSSNCSTAC